MGVAQLRQLLNSAQTSVVCDVRITRQYLELKTCPRKMGHMSDTGQERAQQYVPPTVKRVDYESTND